MENVQNMPIIETFYKAEDYSYYDDSGFMTRASNSNCTLNTNENHSRTLKNNKKTTHIPFVCNGPASTCRFSLGKARCPECP